MFKVRFTYQASVDTDINLCVGDIISNVEDVSNGWSMGLNISTGKTGTFPTNFIVKKLSFKDKVKRMSLAKKMTDELVLMSKNNSESTETLVPRNKAEIPDHVLQRRLTRVPGHSNIIGVKLPKMVPKPVKSFGNNLVQSSRGEYRILKAIFGIFGGFIACGILFVLLRYSYDYSLQNSCYITLGLSLPICVALALSTHMRCIFLLMVPNLFTGKGRAVFMSIIFAMLLAGPVVNIVYNAEQASESMACTQELIYNQTSILRSQLEEPIRRIERTIYEGLDKLKNIANSIKSAIAPVTNAVDAFVNGLNAAKNALENAAKECSNGINTAQSKCEQGINSAKSECEKALNSVDPTDDIINFGKDVANTGDSVVRSIGNGFRRVFGKKRKRRRAMTEEEKNAIELAKQLIGQDTPLQRYGIYLKSRNAEKITNDTRLHKQHSLKRSKRGVLDKICVVLDIGDVCKVVQVANVLVCKPIKFISTVIEGANNAVNSVLNTVISFFYFDFDGGISATGNINSSKTAAQIISEVKADIQSRTKWILTVSGIVSNILIITLLLLFLKSIFYLKKFLSKDRYDNIYITKAFKIYDQQCKAQGKPSVLPLKRKERRNYADTRSPWLSSKEIAHAKTGITKIGIHLLIATVIIVFDYVLYFVLMLIDRYGNLNINIGGNSYLNVSVEGSGFISAFLRAFLTTVELNSDFGVEFNLTTCIPNPSKPDDNNIYKFSFLYFFAFVFLIMQAYGLRLRRKIVTFFYPERDIERIKFLHEKIRHQRKSLLNWLTQHVISRNKQFHMENRITFRGWMEYRCPIFARYFCPCLPKYKICISCENKHNGTIQFHQCEKCQSNYCEECFGDMKYSCLICNTKSNM
ncbi:DC-STAMP domain-containing protein 2-like isoform X1 [Mytilus californianus]|uniref:DC-STAMP domain-containing protein 2-like isoform X1 n=2 Tax=Mytilus californianus TaxID=6549 RepID=UPI0022460FA8|nr:DC-STAMP domain-containing protein 2-like isoform X1 [Mytilus californianus]